MGVDTIDCGDGGVSEGRRQAERWQAAAKTRAKPLLPELPQGFHLYGHAPCGWRWWTTGDDPVPEHDCPKHDSAPLVVINVGGSNGSG
jgi:hypothetical protein